MRFHIRCCVECPKCLTRYLLGFSPYRNGSYAIRTAAASEDYVLYCSCCSPASPSLWRCGDMKPHVVAKTAFQRGYGTFQEVVPVIDKARHSLTKRKTRNDF